MKDSKIPMWPLYVADALMFLSVFVIALPSVRYLEKMGFSDTLFCCIMVLCGMGLLLVPYWLDYKRDLAKKAEHTQEADENFKIIFDQLSELQLMIADVEEKREATAVDVREIKSAEGPKALVAAVAEFKDAVKSKFKEQTAAVDAVGAAFAKLKNELETKLLEFENAKHAESESVSKMRAVIGAKLDEIDTAQQSYSANAARFEAAARQSDDTISGLVADMDIVKDMLSATNESLGDEISQLRERLDNVSLATRLKNDVEDDDEDDMSEEESTQPSQAAPKLGNLLGKALEQAEDTKASVIKLVALNNVPDKLNRESTPVYDENGTKLGDFAEQLKELKSDEPLAGEDDSANLDEDVDDDSNDIENGADVNLVTEENGDINLEDSVAADEVSKDVDAATDADEQAAEKPLGQDKKSGTSDDADFFESADSANVNSESAQKKSTARAAEAIDEEISGMLFDDLPEAAPKPKKIAKGDSAIILNALIGIGNKPYLRGDGEGLSADKGVPMEYVEIGKWRAVFKDMQQPLHFTVLKNDETPSEDEEVFTLEAGQKLELNLNFSQQQQ